MVARQNLLLDVTANSSTKLVFPNPIRIVMTIPLASWPVWTHSKLRIGRPDEDYLEPPSSWIRLPQIDPS